MKYSCFKDITKVAERSLKAEAVFSQTSSLVPDLIKYYPTCLEVASVQEGRGRNSPIGDFNTSLVTETQHKVTHNIITPLCNSINSKCLADFTW